MAEAKEVVDKKTTKKAEVKETKAPKKETKAKVVAEFKVDKKVEEKKVEASVEEKAKAETKTQEVKTFKKSAPKRNNSNLVWGILHIYSSYNNTHLHVTDVTGSETITKVSGGMVSKSDRLKATPNVAMAAAKEIAENCKRAGLNALYVKLRGVGGHNGPMTPGPGAQAAIRMLTRNGIRLGRIEDVTPVPHDTCRKKGGKRGRRV